MVTVLLYLASLCIFLQASNLTTLSDMEWYFGTTKLPIARAYMISGYNSKANTVWFLGGEYNDPPPWRRTDTICIMDLNTMNINLYPMRLPHNVSIRGQSFTQIDETIYYMNFYTQYNFHALNTTSHPATSSVITSSPLTSGAGCITSDQSNIYVIGGVDTGDNIHRETWIYSIKTGDWTNGGRISIGRRYPTCNVVNGYLYLIGGQNWIYSWVSTVEKWNIASGVSFNKIEAKLDPPRQYHSSIDIGAGRIMISGGGTQNVGYSINMVQLLYTMNNNGEYIDEYFETLRPFYVGRRGHNMLQIGRYFMIVGGRIASRPGTTYSDQWEYTDIVPTAQPTVDPTGHPTVADTTSDDEQMKVKKWYDELKHSGIYFIIVGVMIMMFSIGTCVFCYRRKKSKGIYTALLTDERLKSQNY